MKPTWIQKRTFLKTLLAFKLDLSGYINDLLDVLVSLLAIGLDEDIACGPSGLLMSTKFLKQLHVCVQTALITWRAWQRQPIFVTAWTCISLKLKYYTNYLESSLLGFINRWRLWLEVKPLTAELMLMLNVSTVIFHGEEACLLTNLTRTWENYMKCVHNSHEFKKTYTKCSSKRSHVDMPPSPFMHRQPHGNKIRGV